MVRIFLLWILGGIVLIPYSLYQLLFHASRDQYALLIVVPLFWVFGFWGVVGPMLAAWKVHRLMNALDQAGTRTEVERAFEQNAGKEVIVDLIASENRIPKFLARRVYDRMAARLTRDPLPPSPGTGSR